MTKYDSKTTKLWFTSDLHFFHKRILELQPLTRRGADVFEMNAEIITMWNNTVGVDDHVFILGDVSFGKATATIDIVDQLNDKSHLVKGNHDGVITKNAPLVDMFEEVVDYKEIQVDGTLVCMMHYPIIDWKNSHRGSIHLHGHTHGHYQGSGKIFDVGVDNRPDRSMGLWSWYTISKIMESRPVLSHPPG